MFSQRRPGGVCGKPGVERFGNADVGFGDDFVGKVGDEGEEEDEEGEDGEEPGVCEGCAPGEELVFVDLGPDAAGEG